MSPVNLPLMFAGVLGGAVVIEYGVRNVKSGFANAGTAGSTTSSGSSTSSTGKAPDLTGTVTQKSWAAALLAGLGAPVTSNNLANVEAWEAQEGGNWANSAKFNPLNTKRAAAGSSDAGNGIQAFASWDSGLEATLATLRESGEGYEAIIAALKSNAPLGQFKAAVNGSSWGTVFS